MTERPKPPSGPDDLTRLGSTAPGSTKYGLSSTEATGANPFPETVAIHYRLLSELGAGGMGVVYKAIDKRLNRAVAIKAIREQTSLDPRATARLRAEALAVASLDHPYICKIYELVDNGDDTLIVMEFVEGETLGEILRRGVPPFADTLRYASEIAEGLAHAHARGLVHRDVKPANVMVTADGHVKVLDFGLARADLAEGLALHERSPSKALSALAGTPQYMSPEQAEGGTLSPQVDWFSFGVLLFECLTGVLPFAGETAYDYLENMIADRPLPLGRLAPKAPADLVAVIMQCLEKDPTKRPQSADEVLTVLRRATDALAAPEAHLKSARAARATRRWRIAAAAIGLVAVAVAGWSWYQAANDPANFERTLRPFVTSSSEEVGSRISPDGQWLSFISSAGTTAQIFIQRIDGTDATPLALAGGRPLSQAWSPDGRELVCVVQLNKDMVVLIVPAFEAGSARQVAVLGRETVAVRLLRWVRGSAFMQVNDNRGPELVRLDVAQGTIEPMSRAWALEGQLNSVDVRPDGERVAFTMTIGRQQDLWTARLDGTDVTRVTNDAFFDRYPVWSGHGRSIVYQSNRGGPIDLWEIIPGTGRTWSLTSSQTEEIPESVSTDGTRVSFQQESEDAKLWLFDPKARTARQLTADALSDVSPSASADGRTVAFQRRLATPSQGYLIVDSRIFVTGFDGSGLIGEPRAVADGYAASPSRDGRWLAYLQQGRQLQAQHVSTGRLVTLSSRVPLPIMSPFPVDWAERTLAWNPVVDELYFVDQTNGTTLRRARMGQDTTFPPVATVGSDDLIRDPYPSADGRRLGYLTWSAKSFVLHETALDSGVNRELTRVPGLRNGLFGRGWLARDQGFVLVKSVALHEDTSADLEILVVNPSGAVRSAGVATRTFIGTTRLDAGRGCVYLTRSEGGVHNLYEFSLSTGRYTRLTDNTLPGVTFSGIQSVLGGPIIGVRDEIKKDVWLIEARAR